MSTLLILLAARYVPEGAIRVGYVISGVCFVAAAVVYTIERIKERQ